MSIAKVVEALGATETHTRGSFSSSYRARCPGHDDQHPSLDIDVDSDGKVLLICRVCGREGLPRILAAAGLTPADLFADKPQERRSQIVATFDYHDEHGNLLYQSCRVEPGKDGRKKDFFGRRPARLKVDGTADGWTNDLAGVTRVLYRLPELLGADAEHWVFVPEGEKKVDALRKLGCVATCNVGGAKKWLKTYTPMLRGRNVCILPDNDGPGQEHAATVAAALDGVAAAVVVVTLPGLAPKGDVIDWLAAGGTVERLYELIAEERAKPKVKMTPEANGKHTTNGKHEPADDPQWEPPAPIGTLPEPMPFPLDALPPQLADYIEQCAWATNSPVDFAAVPVLAIAAGCIGCSRRLEIQTEHTQPATLFAAVVGLPGTGKSPALEKVAAHLENHDARNLATWKLQSRAWKEENAETRGPEPRVKRLIVDDITTESLCKSIYENQHGLTMVADELSALVAGMNQYKGGQGNDRQIYQKIWAQTAIRVDRKGKPGSPPPPLVIRRPALSIIGGINPAVVESFLTNQQGKRIDDGFIDRFLVSYPKDNPAIEEQRRGIEESAQSAWHRTIDALLTLNPIGDRDSYLPVNIPLTPDGWEAWVDFTRCHAAEVNATDFPAHHRGPWAKLRGYCGRLALVMAMVRMATDGAGGGFGPEQVDHLDVSRAVALIGYFKNHHVRVAGLLRTDPRIEETLKVLGWLKRGVGITFFSRRDAYKDLARSFRAPDALDSPLALLVQHGYICSLDKEERDGPGRKPSQRFAVNPLWDRQK